MTQLCAIPGCRIRGRHLTTCEDTEKCSGCLPRVADDGYSCGRCASLAAENLGTVAELALAVSDAANRLSSGSGGGGAGKPSSRLPLDLGARSRLDAAEGSLYGWARHVSEERGVRLPGLPVAPKPQVGPVCRTRYECTHDSCKAIRDPAHMPVLLAVVAGWLVGHLAWLEQRPEVGEAFADFAACARALRGVARGPAEQRYLGPCGAVRPCEGLDVGDWPEADCGNHVVHEPHDQVCDGDVYAREGAERGRCRTCGAEVATQERRAWLDGEVRGYAYTTSEIVAAYPEIRRNTINQWAARGRLAAHDHDGSGRARYNLGDVLDLAAGDAARREGDRATRARRAAARAAESETAA